MKRSCGLSGLSASAAPGQALTQLRHSVHLAVSTTRLPNGEPAAGRAISSAGCGRLREQVVDGQFQRGRACRPAPRRSPPGPRSGPARSAAQRPARAGRAHRALPAAAGAGRHSPGRSAPPGPRPSALAAPGGIRALPRAVVITQTWLAPWAMAASQRSMPTLAVCHTATGSTRAGSPCRLRSRRLRLAPRPRSSSKARAGGLAVDQQGGVAAAGVAVGGEHGAQPPALIDRCRGRQTTSRRSGTPWQQAPQPTHR